MKTAQFLPKPAFDGDVINVRKILKNLRRLQTSSTPTVPQKITNKQHSHNATENYKQAVLLQCHRTLIIVFHYSFIFYSYMTFLHHKWGASHYIKASLTTPGSLSLPHGVSHYLMASLTTPGRLSLSHDISQYPMASPTAPWRLSLHHDFSQYPMVSLTTPWPLSLPHGFSHYPRASLITPGRLSLPQDVSHYPICRRRFFLHLRQVL
jgi:hypothetical protein